MDKETYETYEYLPNNTDTEQNQFLVVQDDDTFLVNRQVQYVTQDDGQTCTVYNITPQQFFVDVNNSADLITTDNFILPASDVTTNLYSNSYLLQAVSNTGSDHNEDVATSSDNIDLANNVDKQNGNCTEITLSDDQYKILEQRGWVLLETQDKVLLLDTLGLHDVTNNNELIEQLSEEVEGSINSEANCTKPIKLEIELESTATKTTLSDLNNLEHVLDATEREKYTNPEPHIKNESRDDNPESKKHIVDELKDNDIVVKKPLLSLLKKHKVKPQPHKLEDRKPIRIPCKFSLKDIPEKIVLGKSENGNNLVAKVVRKLYTSVQKTKEEVIQTSQEIDNNNVNIDQSLHNIAIEDLIQKAYEHKVESTEEELSSVRDVIKQLVQITMFETSEGINLVITKIIANDSRNTNAVPSIVTGRLEPSSCGVWNFKHMPDMLQKLMADSAVSVSKANKVKHEPTNLEDFSFIHVLITETQRDGTVEAISITVNKRYVPIKVQAHTQLRKRQISKLFACGSCAAIFNTELELTVHQETHTIDAEATLTIDTDNIPDGLCNNVKLNTYYIWKDSKGTQYGCLQCSLKFNKLSNCQRHMKTHQKPSENKCADDNENTDNTTEPMYKCKMCASRFFHSATLSKHIVLAHINATMSLRSNHIT